MLTTHSVTLLTLIACFLAGSAFVPDATPAESVGVVGINRRLMATPAPDDLRIDGKLTEWNMDTAIFVARNPQVADRYHAWVAVMYDNEALYLGASVRDDTPMKNLHGPEGGADWAWNADAMQFRLFTDPENGPTVFLEEGKTYEVAHLLLWHFTPEKRPCLKIEYGPEFEPFGQNDGVVSDDLFDAAYHKREEGQGYSFEYRIPWELLRAERPLRAGDAVAATLQVNFDDGSGLRSPRRFAFNDLLSAYATNPWRQYESWGRIVFMPTREVDPRFAQNQPLPDRPKPLSLTYELPRDAMVSLDVQNQNGETVRRLLVEQPGKEGVNRVAWDGTDFKSRPLPAGDYRIRGIHYEPIRTRYLLGANNAGQPTWQTPDGTGAWGGDHGLPTSICLTDHGIALAWSVQESAPGIILIDRNDRKQWGAFFNSATHMATDGTRLFFGGTRRARTIRILDAETGRRISFDGGRDTVDTWQEHTPFPTITGLAYHDGILYAAYGEHDAIVHYDAHTGDRLDIVSAPEPGHLEPTGNGELWVASTGRVMRIDADGQTVATIEGPHVDEPRGIASDRQGTLYIANGGKLHNVSVFSTGGDYLRSIGKTGGRPLVGRHDPDAMLEPWDLTLDDHGRLWVAEHIDRPKRISVWDTDSGELLEEMFGSPRFANFAGLDPHNFDELVSADGTLWDINLETGESDFRSTLWRSTDENTPESFGNFRLVRGANGHQYIQSYRHPNILYLRRGDLAVPFVMLMPDGNRIWQADNADGRYQPGEFTELSVNLGSHIQALDRELNLWFDGYVFRPIGFDDARPRYDFTSPEETGIRAAGPMPRVMNDPDGESFYVIDPGQREQGQVRWGEIRKMRADGTVLWRYPRVVRWRDAWNMGIPTGGDIYGPWGLPSMKGDFLAVGTFRGSCHVLTREGMYVTELLPDIRRMTFEPAAIKQEMYGGTLAKWEDGKYLLATGDNDARVLAVKGLDTVESFTDEVTITEQDRRRVREEITEYRKERASAMPLVIARGHRSLIDVPRRGEPQAQAIERRLDDARQFMCRAAWERDPDEPSLALRWSIRSPSEMVSTHSAAALPDSGNVIEIAHYAENAKRRLFIGRAPNGNAIAWAVDGDEEQEVSEYVTIEEYEYDQNEDRIEIRFSLPTRLLGWRPEPSGKVLLNLGYHFGDAEGITRLSSAYWQKPAANQIDTRDDYAMGRYRALVE